MSDVIKDSAKSTALTTSDSINFHGLATDQEQKSVSVFFTFEASDVLTFNIIDCHLIIILTEGYIRIILSFLFNLKNSPCAKRKLLYEFCSELHVTAKSYFEKQVSGQLTMLV